MVKTTLAGKKEIMYLQLLLCGCTFKPVVSYKIISKEVEISRQLWSNNVFYWHQGININRLERRRNN